MEGVELWEIQEAVDRISTKGLAWDLIPAWIPKLMVRLTPSELMRIFFKDERSMASRYAMEEEEDRRKRRSRTNKFPLSAAIPKAVRERIWTCLPEAQYLSQENTRSGTQLLKDCLQAET